MADNNNTSPGPVHSREQIKANIRTLQQLHAAPGLTEEQRSEIREEIGGLALGLVLEDQLAD